MVNLHEGPSIYNSVARAMKAVYLSVTRKIRSPSSVAAENDPLYVPDFNNCNPNANKKAPQILEYLCIRFPRFNITQGY